MVTRRIYVTMIGVVLLSRPVLGTVRLWSVKTMSQTAPGTVLHTVAEVAAILT